MVMYNCEVLYEKGVDLKMLENDCAYRIRRLLDGIRQNPQHIFQHAKRMEKLREEH